MLKAPAAALTSVVLLTAALSASASPASGGVLPFVTNFGDNQVWICHFPGHEGDFVTFRGPPNTVVCDEEGGLVLHVGRPACWEGHAAVARFGKDCDTTDQP
jgi:hypothetical protein